MNFVAKVIEIFEFDRIGVTPSENPSWRRGGEGVTGHPGKQDTAYDAAPEIINLASISFSGSLESK